MVAPRKPKRNPFDEYPDDIFKDTRMSFGDHIEELRTRMFRAIKWLLLFMVIGFILDAIGKSAGNPKIGIAFPMLQVITDPIESQVRDFYYRRAMNDSARKLAELTNAKPAEIQEIEKKLEANGNNLSSLTAGEREMLLGAPSEMPVEVPVKALELVFGPAKPGTPATISFKMKVYPGYINYLSMKGEALLASKKYLATLSAQEGFVVYFKVQILCGIVLASPFILYQFWMFVGAGLYPHERKYIYMMFGPSLGLFLAGVLLCQFVVLPNAVRALLMFNEWLGFDPEIRLNEWLGLAIILPLVFGISFQTPLVMVFLNRIGMFTAQDYIKKWKHACMVLAVFAAIITPTPDAVTMLYLFLPMFSLYLIGIIICHYFPGIEEEDAEAEAAEEVAV
jgi:sec-independent protein translocase protein TatC